MDQKTPAVVSEKAATPRSYVVETNNGNPVPRNRLHLIPMPESIIKESPPLKKRLHLLHQQMEVHAIRSYLMLLKQLDPDVPLDHPSGLTYRLFHWT